MEWNVPTNQVYFLGVVGTGHKLGYGNVEKQLILDKNLFTSKITAVMSLIDFTSICYVSYSKSKLIFFAALVLFAASQAERCWSFSRAQSLVEQLPRDAKLIKLDLIGALVETDFLTTWFKVNLLLHSDSLCGAVRSWKLTLAFMATSLEPLIVELKTVTAVTHLSIYYAVYATSRTFQSIPTAMNYISSQELAGIASRSMSWMKLLADFVQACVLFLVFCQLISCIGLRKTAKMEVYYLKLYALLSAFVATLTMYGIMELDATMKVFEFSVNSLAKCVGVQSVEQVIRGSTFYA